MELESQIDSINQINEKKGVDFKIISPRVTGYLSVCIKTIKRISYIVWRTSLY